MKFSPITKRRWKNFKSNRRGYVSLWLMVVVLCVTLPAEFIANDRPALIYYKEAFYMPIFHSYPETTFDGYFETETRYADPFIRQQINAHGWMIEPIIPYSARSMDYEVPRAPYPPSSRHWFGVDDQGRDVLARLIYGCRISLLFAFMLSIASSVIGIIVGAIQGYYGGMIDLLSQRFVEIWSGLPMLYMLIILTTLVEPNFWWLLLLLLLFSWMELVGVVRAEFLKVRNYDYVRAARALGVGEITIMWRHIMPNAMVATLTYMPFIVNGAMTTLTSLDFLGFGLPVGSPSLGDLLSQGKNNPTSPWLGLTAFATLSLLLTMMMFIGEALRDAYNPHKVFRHDVA